MSFPAPDQVEGDVKDTVYQTTGIAFFIRMGFPIKLGMTLRTRYHSIFRLFDQNDKTYTSQACPGRESLALSFPAPDQVEGDVKDTVYQIAGTAFFIRMGFPIRLKMTLRINS